MTSKTWQLELPCGPLLTANQRNHRQAQARITRQLRGEAKYLAMKARVPAMAHSHVYAFVIPPDRKRRDPANWYPSVKACIDGITDAGVWPDDNPTYVTGPDMRLGEPRTCPKCRQRAVHLTLYIREI